MITKRLIRIIAQQVNLTLVHTFYYILFVIIQNQ